MFKNSTRYSFLPWKPLKLAILNNDMKMQKLYPLGRTIALYAALFLWLSLTDPRKLPIVLLIVPFGLLFAAVFMTVSLILKQFMPRMTVAKRRIAASCVSGLPSFLLILSSVNQLTWRDVALVAFLSIILLFYASRARFSTS
jgi:hypothetical protein